MTGTVDGRGRVLIRITIRHPNTGAFLDADAWIDTGFNGELLLPQNMVAQLGLQLKAQALANLADGSKATFDVYRCVIHWSGKSRLVEALSRSGRFPLVGVGLLRGHVLVVDYPNRTVSIQ